MKKIIPIALLIVSPTLFAEAPDVVKGCFDCHGDNGVSTEATIPTIAGFSPTFMETTLFAYKDEVRPAVESKYIKGDTSRAPTDMKKIADQLSDDQITAISEFFAGQTFVPAKQEFDASLVATGEKIHDSKCKKCHDEAGSVADDDAGFLAGQWTHYLNESMKHFKAGTREMDKKMKQKVDQLSDAEWAALAAYYASKQ